LRESDGENLAGQDTGRDRLSHTKLSTLNNCRRKYEFEYVERLELIERPKALDMGRAFQKGIELNDPVAGARALRDATSIRTQAMEDELRKDETAVEAAARLYLDRWPAPEAERREFQYRVRLRNPWTGRYSNTFDLEGYADGVEDKGSHLALTENKFVGQIDAAKIKRLMLDRQVTLACYGLWRATGKPVREVHYRHIRKPTIRQKQGETVEQFCERLTADYADPARRDFYTHPESLFRSDEDYLRIEAELWEWADDLRRAHRRRLYPRNTSHCHDYGGCAFIPICVGDPDARALYQTKPPRDEEEEARAA
jgi:hypothetical protein